MAFSGDGRYVVTASLDNSAVLWETSSGKKLLTFQGHTSPVTSVGRSSDGKHLVTGSYDRTAILWDASTGKKLQTFQGNTGAVTSVAISGDGKHLVMVTQDLNLGLDSMRFGDKTILWNVSTGKPLHTLEGRIRSVGWSADGRQVVTGSDDGTTILWEALTGKPRLVLRGPSSCVVSVALSSGGRHLWTTAFADGTTRLWDVMSGKQLGHLLSLDDGKDWLVVTPDGFFDGSKDAWRHVAYRNVGTLQVIDDKATLQRFYRPGLMALLLKGQKVAN